MSSTIGLLDIDDNRSVWVDSTPGYQPLEKLDKDISADLAIIGGGFTGVSTAYHFSCRYPEKRVVLLEAKILANGTSGRNGGQMLNWIRGGELNIDDNESLANTWTVHYQPYTYPHPLRNEGVLRITFLPVVVK